MRQGGAIERTNTEVWFPGLHADSRGIRRASIVRSVLEIFIFFNPSKNLRLPGYRAANLFPSLLVCRPRFCKIVEFVSRTVARLFSCPVPLPPQSAVQKRNCTGCEYSIPRRISSIPRPLLPGAIKQVFRGFCKSRNGMEIKFFPRSGIGIPQPFPLP